MCPVNDNDIDNGRVDGDGDGDNGHGASAQRKLKMKAEIGDRRHLKGCDRQTTIEGVAEGKASLTGVLAIGEQWRNGRILEGSEGHTLQCSTTRKMGKMCKGTHN